jgi:glutamate racemase
MPPPVPFPPPTARPRLALLDAGLGLLAAAAALRRMRPDADLVLTCDPDGMPWGPRTPADLAARAMAAAEAAAAHHPDALVVACNTATLHALPALRARFEPGVPVVGTVPAVRPAALHGGPVAVWATPATTGSSGQRALIDAFADGVRVTEVACPGLSDAVEHADEEAVGAAVAAAVERTPPDVRAVVLGCTHYELIAGPVRAGFLRAGRPPVELHGTADAVAAQALRRIGVPARPYAPAVGTLRVLHSGRPAALPPAALAYPEGRALLSGTDAAAGEGGGGRGR